MRATSMLFVGLRCTPCIAGCDAAMTHHSSVYSDACCCWINPFNRDDKTIFFIRYHVNHDQCVCINHVYGPWHDSYTAASVVVFYMFLTISEVLNCLQYSVLLCHDACDWLIHRLATNSWIHCFEYWIHCLFRAARATKPTGSHCKLFSSGSVAYTIT